MQNPDVTNMFHSPLFYLLRLINVKFDIFHFHDVLSIPDLTGSCRLYIVSR
jgi:hypothetical protein